MTSRMGTLRGRHKIFLGASAGVGKTFKALSELRERKAQGLDVVVGLLETHGRAETAQAATGLEIFPRKIISYKGINFGELDTEGLIKRKPDLVLVDELAHTNAPSSKNAKRYQDVDELLSAGLNVVSTVNVQHLESLNDIVAQMTGVRVRERVPDQIVLSADEVVLIDISPEQLRERLLAGKIYSPDKVNQALASFFTNKNLVALREIALRQVADTVEEPPIPEVIGRGVKERIVVAIEANSASTRLIRRGARVAQRLAGDFIVIHVKRAVLDEEQTKVLQDLENLAHSLQAEFIILEKRNVVDALVSFIRAQQITQIILGESHRSQMTELFQGSIIRAILRRTHGVDVFIIGDD